MKKNNKAYTFGRFFDDFTEGDIFYHEPGKTVTESDSNLFTLITMNHHPVHLDKNYASKAQHKQILVAGPLVFSLVVGMTVRDISGKAIANLGYEEINHLGPCFIDDTLYARTEVLNVRESKSKKDRGIVRVRTYGFNQRDEDILVFTRNILIPKNKNNEK